MSKVKYKAPTQATSKFVWNGFQILPGYIYGRDALGAVHKHQMAYQTGLP